MIDLGKVIYISAYNEVRCIDATDRWNHDAQYIEKSDEVGSRYQ